MIKPQICGPSVVSFTSFYMPLKKVMHKHRFKTEMTTISGVMFSLRVDIVFR